jgi:GNAT superfamily N-acetyltransferase
MRIRLVRKEHLSAAELQAFHERLHASIEHEGECGPVRAWYSYTSCLYAFLSSEGAFPVAIAEASGRPISSPGWWVDPIHRGSGYGKELVDLLAQHLRADGVTSIGPMLIQTPGGKYDVQSSKLVVRLRGHFP